jgi:hypothetical protein
MSICGESLSDVFPMRMVSYERSVAIRQYSHRSAIALFLNERNNVPDTIEILEVRAVKVVVLDSDIIR